MLAFMAWRRNSVAVSIKRLVSFSRTQRELRVRLFLGLSLWHTAQSHVITGTPWDVPVPRNVISIVPSFPSLTRTFVLYYNQTEQLFSKEAWLLMIIYC